MTKLLFKVIVVFALMVIGSKTYAQKDLIVTQAGEEIRCKILDETPTRFVYAYLGPKNKILRNEIFKNLVSSFKYSYYPTDVLQNDKLIEKTKSGQSNRGVPLKSSEEKQPEAAKETTKKNMEASVDTKNSNEVAQKPNSELTKSSIDKSKANASEIKKTSDTNMPLTDEKPLKNAKSEKATEKTDEKTDKLETKKQKEDISPLADPEPVSEFKNYLKYRIGAKGGLGNIIAPNSDTSPYGLYKEKLLRGWMFGIDAAYFFGDNIGIGATYTNYQARNSSTSLDYPDLFSQEPIKNGQLSNKVSHKFLGPTFLFRKSIDYKTFAILTLSPGMHLYSDKGLTNNSAFNFKGQAYGAAATLGLDFLLGNDIFGRDIVLSLEGGYNYGQIASIDNTLEKVKLATPINLNRLDFTIGLRFTRFPMYLR
ncbi:MAG: hypothetical protein KAX81_01680 [Leadbetterella sp.]|nr:hypothetical protein [Leadbetterella sp.]